MNGGSGQDSVTFFGLKGSRLRAEKHFGVQARNRQTLNETGLVAVTVTPCHEKAFFVPKEEKIATH